MSAGSRREMNRCAWCRKKVTESEQPWLMGGRAREGADLTEFEGGMTSVWVSSPKREVEMIVPGRDSEARKSGYDVIFVICSDKCADKLKGALIKEGVPLARLRGGRL